jgi:hypothetical protein
MRLVRSLATLLLLLAAGGAPLLGQQRTTCDLIRQPGGTLNVMGGGTPGETYFIRRAYFDCTGGRVIIADSATFSRASGQITLFGNVRVDDPQRSLRAQFAQYFTQVRQISARDQVTMRDVRTGSLIRSDLLNYYEATAQRRQSLVIATRTTGPLARAILYDEQSAAPGAARDSMIVDAQEIQITGEENFRAIGSASLTRDSLVATGHQIEYWENVGTLNILGGGLVTMPDYELRGDSITATLAGETREIREVLTRHAASLVSTDMNVTAPAIRLFFENGGVERMVAMNWRQRPNAPVSTRPVAVSEQFRMESDSIDVLAPEQQIREAVAIGTAWVQRFTPDSLKPFLPEAEPDVARLIEHDWIRGDTVRAFFTAATVDPAAVNTGANAERVIERITATGGPAQAMHKTRPDDAADDARLSIAYLVGNIVAITFADGLVTEVRASDDVRGVYLQPRDAARATSAQQSPRRRSGR